MLSKNRLALTFKKIKYLGKHVECSICGSHYNFFMPFGLNRRENALCTNCGALERHRLVWKYMQQQTNLFKDDITLLHMAPEKMYCERFQHMENLKYFPCDLDPEKYPFIKMIKADVTNLQFENDSFDVILCNHVLEHIPDDRKAMQELYRVLKPNGWAILQVPIDHTRAVTYEDFSITDPKEREKVFGQDDHVRIYGKDYSDRLSESGFTVKKDDWVSTFNTAEIFKYGLDKNELIYFCTK